MACIARIDTRPFRLELEGELQWGRGSRLEALEHVLVRVQTDDGHEGVAEAPARPTIYGETVASIEAIIARHLAPKLLGLELADEKAIEQMLRSVANNHTARGALDIAIHEARTMHQGSSLYDTFRGPRERVQVSFILGISDLSTMLSEARSVFERGARVFKVKVGRDKAHDAQVIGALQHEFAGAGVLLYADANEALALETAAQDLERLAKLGIHYVEEPLPVELIRARAALREAQILPIIADDSCFSLRDLERELDFGTFDILNIKPARTGYSDSLRMLGLAASAGKGVMMGSQASAGLGTLHTALLASDQRVTHASELSFPLKLKTDILNRRLEFEEGYLSIPELRGYRLASFEA